MESKSLNHQKEPNGISFLDIIVEFFNNIKLVSKIIIIFLLIGFITVFVNPTKYKSTSSVVADLENGQDMRISGGLSALRNFGVNLGSTMGGITPDTYPEIIRSREVLYDVIHTKFYIPKLDTTLELVKYLNRKTFFKYLKKYTIKLPITLYRKLLPKRKIVSITDQNKEILYLSKDEQQAINLVRNDILEVKSDLETGIITITAVTKSPILSAEINKTILESFRKRVRQLYEQKNSENLKFIEARLKEAKRELDKAEEAVVNFLEKNTEPQTIKLQTELERLKREVTFKANLYNQLQLQYAQLNIEIKKQEPVIRIIERPIVAEVPAGIGKLNTLFLFFFTGFLIGLVFTFFKLVIRTMEFDEKTHVKLDRVRKNLQELRLSTLFKIRKIK